MTHLPEVIHGAGQGALCGDVGRVPGVVVHLQREQGLGEQGKGNAEEVDITTPSVQSGGDSETGGYRDPNRGDMGAGVSWKGSDGSVPEPSPRGPPQAVWGPHPQSWGTACPEAGRLPGGHGAGLSLEAGEHASGSRGQCPPFRYSDSQGSPRSPHSPEPCARTLPVGTTLTTRRSPSTRDWNPLWAVLRTSGP